MRFMKTKEFKEYAYIRNGVETLPSVLRRKYNVDAMPVRGKLRSRLYFGIKVGAVNIKKLLKYYSGLALYVQNPAFS